MGVDRQRIAAVRVLEALEYTYRNWCADATRPYHSRYL